MELNENPDPAPPAVNGEAGNGKGPEVQNGARRGVITSATAADYARRGDAAKKARNGAAGPDIRLIRARMAECERMLRGCEDARLWDMLSRSYERFFKVWQVLAGLPGPGQRRPGPERAKRAATVDPVMPAATEATEESFTDGTEIPPDSAQVPTAQ